eukprot:CAMPEP_0171181142 /NCGR_PEP_ID=MMETSP0790-20130122/14111_1 /TAXON_ID=2925 /ORGANISM="Alexandrium catenella, Strain OF101" /LENGTH=120 /DNA_ID=CAMNT_0011646079 /DNA_START=1 /DNA_END=360 /DNA_ORIENTATION=+
MPVQSPTARARGPLPRGRRPPRALRSLHVEALRAEALVVDLDELLAPLLAPHGDALVARGLRLRARAADLLRRLRPRRGRGAGLRLVLAAGGAHSAFEHLPASSPRARAPFQGLSQNGYG